MSKPQQKRIPTSDATTLRSKGWRKDRKGLWISPYTRAHLSEERARRVELMMNPAGN